MTTPFVSLTHQVSDAMKAGIEEGRWVDWLPGERLLVSELNVSRKTVRKALAQLRHDRWIESELGRGHRIIRRARSRAQPTTAGSVGLLLPVAVEFQRTFTNLWISELRVFLAAHNLQLRVFSGQKFYSGSPTRALEKIVQHEPQQAWVLTHSTTAMQRWFYQRRVPAVVAGSIHGGVPLPSVDLDYQALCRHAAGKMLHAGHRRLAIVVGEPERGGDRESINGFERAIELHSGGDAKVVVCRHDCSPGGLARAIQRLTKLRAAPSAIMVANSAHYLTVHTSLAARGFTIPRDVSLISRDDDPYLAFVHPEPTRYACPPAHMARQIGRSLITLGSSDHAVPRVAKLMPEFVKGASFATRA